MHNPIIDGYVRLKQHNRDITMSASSNAELAAILSIPGAMLAAPVEMLSKSTSRLKTPRKQMQVVPVLDASIGIAAIRDRYQKDCCHGNARAAKLLSKLVFRYQADDTGGPRLRTYRYGSFWWEKSYEDWAAELDATVKQVRTDFAKLKEWGLAEVRPLKVYEGKNAGKTVTHARVLGADGAASLSGWPDYSQIRIVLDCPNGHPIATPVWASHSNAQLGIHKAKEGIEKKKEKEKAYKHANGKTPPSAKSEFPEESSGQQGNPKASKQRPKKTLGKLLPPCNPDADPWAAYNEIASRHDMDVLLSLCIAGQFVPAHWTMLSNDMCKELLRAEAGLEPVSRDYSLEEILDLFGDNRIRANQMAFASFGKSGCKGMWDYAGLTGWERLAGLRAQAADPKQAEFCYATKPNLATLASSIPVILEWLGPCADPFEDEVAEDVLSQPVDTPAELVEPDAAVTAPEPVMPAVDAAAPSAQQLLLDQAKAEAQEVATNKAWFAQQLAEQAAANAKKAKQTYHA